MIIRRFRIGSRTVKTAIGASVSITVAFLLQLDNATTAGIITILSIKATKQGSFLSAGVRFCSCGLGIIFAYLFFEGIGYHPAIIGVLLLLFIPTLVMFKLQEGIVTSAVIILHLYAFQEMNVAILLNELGIIVIGIGIALILNTYMPSMEKKLIQYQRDIEENYKKIFQEFAVYMREGDQGWDGKEIARSVELLQTAKSMAFRDVKNHFRRHENEYYYYFKMREKQFEIIERLLPIISTLHIRVEEGMQIADFLDEVSEGVGPGNTSHIYLQKLEQLRIQFRAGALPQTREEFEVRAKLFHFLNEMERYLLIKLYFNVDEGSE